jgi:hypothetical protein
MKLQIIGPMSGHEGWNYDAFHEAAATLRAAGHEVFNPAETGGGDTTLPRAYYMRASIGGLLNADAVVTLPGWETSPGSKTELRVALALGLLVMSYERCVCMV